MKSRVSLRAMALVAAFCFPGVAVLAADETRPAHREVSIPATPEAAWAILQRDGALLQRYLQKQSLTGVDLHEIHMLSYSLEVAVHRLRSDWERIANDLEEMHLNSESGNAEKTRAHAEAFLEALARVKGK